MPLNDTAVMIPGQGYVLTDVAMTATKPTLAQLQTFAEDPTVPPTGFVNLGHTSLDNVLGFPSEGGESEVKGTWQNPSLREVLTSAVVDSIVVPALQVMDNDILTMYYGGGDASVANEFSIPDVAVPQQRGLLIVMLDGQNGVLGGFAPRASIKRDDSLAVDPTDFMTAPLRFTMLKATGKPKFTWIADGLGAAA